MSKPQIYYKSKAYKIFVKRDFSGANSIRDLAEDFAYDVTEKLGILCESERFDKALAIIEDMFFDIMKYNILGVLKVENRLTENKNNFLQSKEK